MTARPMSPAREAALAVMEELWRINWFGEADVPPAFEARVMELINATIRDAEACEAARFLVFDHPPYTITIGSRTYTIRTVDDLRTYLEREVPEPGR